MSDSGRKVISRREGERIRIGNDIEISVTYARSGCARISIKAPKSVIIQQTDRDEDRRDREEFRQYQDQRYADGAK